MVYRKGDIYRGVARSVFKCRHNDRGEVPGTAYARNGSTTRSTNEMVTVSNLDFEHDNPLQGVGGGGGGGGGFFF